jgi:hypothetical protein
MVVIVYGCTADLAVDHVALFTPPRACGRLLPPFEPVACYITSSITSSIAHALFMSSFPHKASFTVWYWHGYPYTLLSISFFQISILRRSYVI